MELLPRTGVLMLTASTEEDAVIEAVAAGSTGYLQKHSGSEELLTVVREVAADRLRISGDTLRRVIAAIRKDPDLTGGHDAGPLTPREQEFLTLFASGNSYARIAEVNGNSPMTIRNTVYRIQAKLGVTTKQEIVVWAGRTFRLLRRVQGPTRSSLEQDHAVTRLVRLQETARSERGTRSTGAPDLLSPRGYRHMTPARSTRSTRLWVQKYQSKRYKMAYSPTGRGRYIGSCCRAIGSRQALEAPAWRNSCERCSRAPRLQMVL